jgi:MoaA/NifB/PqqE/SkfB family radical SAM enzyme
VATDSQIDRRVEVVDSFVSWDSAVAPCYNVFYDITRACNLRCVHCFVTAAEPQDDELSTDEARRLIRDLASLHPARVTFTGGEPLLRPDLLDVASEASALRRKGIGYLKLTTNGTLVTAASAADIARLFDQVNVSIDGFEDAHDSLRGCGSFEGAIRGLRYLVAAGANPKVSITVTNLNASSLRPLLSYLQEEEGVGRFNLRPLWIHGRATTLAALAASEDAMSDLLTDLGMLSAGFTQTRGASESPGARPRVPCPAAYTMSIDSNGSVYPCVFLQGGRHRAGSFRAGDMVSAYHDSAVYRRVRARPRTCVLSRSGAASCGSTVDGSEGPCDAADGVAGDQPYPSRPSGPP